MVLPNDNWDVPLLNKLAWVLVAGAQTCSAAKVPEHEAGYFDLYRHAGSAGGSTTVL